MSEEYGTLRLRRFEILGLLPDTESTTLWHRCGSGFMKATAVTLELADRLPDDCKGYLGKARDGHKNKRFVVQILMAPFAVETWIKVDALKAGKRHLAACEGQEIMR